MKKFMIRTGSMLLLVISMSVLCVINTIYPAVGGCILAFLYGWFYADAIEPESWK